MKTIINKFFFGILFLFLAWKGLDGLIINVFHSTTKTYDILQFETSNEAPTRNIEILNGIPYRKELMYLEADAYSPIDIIYPLVSSEQLAKAQKNEPITIKVLIQLNEQDPDCIIDKSCLPEDSTAVKGLVKVELENLHREDFNYFESDLISLDDQVILLQPNEVPIAWYWNLIMFGAGILFGVTILKSFFRRASSLKEYWQKITEQEEK